LLAKNEQFCFLISCHKKHITGTKSYFENCHLACLHTIF